MWCYFMQGLCLLARVNLCEYVHTYKYEYWGEVSPNPRLNILGKYEFSVVSFSCNHSLKERKEHI
jgi:hypothetical protein